MPDSAIASVNSILTPPASVAGAAIPPDAAHHSPVSGVPTLTTGQREVGSVWVSQTREGDSMLGVVIEDVNYIGFKVVNDDDLKAPHYRLYCVGDSSELHEKGQVWKLITGVEKRRKKPSRDKPVTTLFIRIAEQGVDGSGADSAENQVSYPPDSASAPDVASAAKYYLGKMKDQVSLHPSGSGLMGERYPAFGVYKREFSSEALLADDADNSNGEGNCNDAQIGSLEAAGADAGKKKKRQTKNPSITRSGKTKRSVPATAIPASGDDTMASALADALEGSAESRIWGKSLDASRKR
jgi:hypothetical protein